MLIKHFKRKYEKAKVCAISELVFAKSSVIIQPELKPARGRGGVNKSP